MKLEMHFDMRLQSQSCITPRMRLLASSLDGPGFSVTLMNVVDTGIDKSVLQLLDEPSEAAGWTAPVKADTWTTQWKEDAKDASSSELVAEENFGDLSFDLDSGLKKLKSGLKAMIATEPEVTKFDTVVGDGDCGTTLKRGAEGEYMLF